MKKICEWCKKEYECFDKKHHGRSCTTRRRYNSKTCSHQCSILRTRDKNKIKSAIRRKNKKLI